MNEELKQLSESFATLKTNFLKLKETLGMPMSDKEEMPDMDKKMNDMMGYVFSMIDNVHTRIDNLGNYIYDVESKCNKHSSVGHLPPLSASQLKKALDVCGAGEDYDVSKPYITSANTKRGYCLEASYIPSKK